MDRAALWRRIWAAGLFALVFDRVTKWWVVETLDLAFIGRIEVFPPFLNLTMAWNHGINFGIFASDSEVMRWALVVLALAIAVGLVIWVLRRSSAALAWGGGLVAGGAIGNAWDRVQYGAVADFINMSCCGIQNPYAFNIADAAIFLGAAVIAIRA